MNRQTRDSQPDDVEVGIVPFGGSMAPAMALYKAEDGLHLYQRPRGDGDLRYVMTMTAPNGDSTPVLITSVAPDTWISGVGLLGLRDAAARLWQSRPRV